MDRDPRLTEFLKDKIAFYPFAEKLMDFCLERTSKPSWEDFIKKTFFPIPIPNGPLKVCQVIFLNRYARLWIGKRREGTMDDALGLLRGIFGEEAEITPQKDDKAIGVMIRTEDQCEYLMNWLSDLENFEVERQSAPTLMKKISESEVIRAIESYEEGEHDGLDALDNGHALRHAGGDYPPTTILALASEFVEDGRRLENRDFQGISPSRKFKVLETAGFEIFPKSESPTAKELFHLVRSKHILQAIEDFIKGTPHEFGASTQYDLIHEGSTYPPKAILGLACRLVAGGRLTKPQEFSGGQESTCFLTLRREGFTIIPKKEAVEQNPLGEPFSSLFQNLEQANEMLDFWKQTILVLQDEETGRSKPLVLTSRRQGKKVWIVLNFGQWVVLSFSSTEGLRVTLPRDLLNELKGETFEGGFSEKLDGVKYTHEQLDLDILLGEEVKPIYDETLVKIRNQFGDWSGSPYNQAHRSELYEGIMDSEKRLQILRDGISPRSQSLGSKRNVWVIAPGEGGKEWENFQYESIASIGWNEIGDLSGLEEKKAFQEAVAESHPESGSQKVGKMLHDFAVRMQEGDLIFAKAGTKAILGWGIVSSDYRYDENATPHVHVREVQWKEDSRFELPENIRLPIKTLTRYEEDNALCQILGEFYDCFSSPEVDTAPEYSKEEALKELFLGEKKFDKIIQTLKRKKNLVLQGAPGTGKTFIAKRVAFTLMGVKDDSRAQMIQFHQSSSYEDFIQGFRPNADGQFVLRDGVFHQFCRLAKGSPDDDFVFIIDEINRGNLSKVFGELMMLIEPDKRDPKYAMQLSYSEGENEPFYVPENLYMIGTMNTADRSLSLVDYALRRRFAFLEMEPNFDSPVFEETLGKRGISSGMITKIRSMMSGLNQKIEDDAMNLGKGFRVGHSFFVPTNKILDEREWFDGIIEFEILPLIEEYWMDDPTGLTEARAIIGLEA